MSGDAQVQDSRGSDSTTAVTDAGARDSPSDLRDAAANSDDSSSPDVSQEDALGASDGGDAGDAADAGSAIACVPSTDAGDGGDGAAACPGTMTCCNGRCADTSKDPRNCGACGSVCAATQFCTGMACDDAVFKNICANAKATWVSDPDGPDNTAGNAMGNALATSCSPAVSVMTANEDAGIAQDLASGRPITGPGDTLIAGGGPYGQTGVAYMESQQLTPLFNGSDATNAWVTNRKTNMNLLVVAISSLTATHDYFLLELSIEPTSGTLCCFGFGLYAPGTIAAGYFFQNQVVPNRATFTDAWYVYEWTAANDAGTPGPNDTFNLVAHGM